MRDGTALIADGDQTSAWNATFVDECLEAVRDVPSTEVRRPMAARGLARPDDGEPYGRGRTSTTSQPGDARKDSNPPPPRVALCCETLNEPIETRTLISAMSLLQLISALSLAPAYAAGDECSRPHRWNGFAKPTALRTQT